MQEEIERNREDNFDKTYQDFRRVERVVRVHENRKGFIVVRMYYFNEDVTGNGRSGERCTFEGMAVDLGRDEKTLRRWRNIIVNDMAVCLFGIEAAVSAGTIQKV